MNPNMFRHRILIEENRGFIHELAAESVSPAQIQKMLQQCGIELTTMAERIPAYSVRPALTGR